MKRVLIVVSLVALVALLSMPGIAPAAAPKGGTSRVVPLGWTIHNGRLAQGYAFVHGVDRTAGAAKGGGKTQPLYTFLASGARWRTTEDFVVNTANGHGVSDAAVMSDVTTSLGTWEPNVSFDIFGSGTSTGAVLAADWNAPDDRNEVYFSDTELDAGTVAVTVVWGYFSGPPRTRELFEWDMVFNDGLTEPWGDVTAAQSFWDIRDIATHELGHAAGLGDLYQTAATELTMYGYASPGETKKRTLEPGDIAGIKALYK